jgi:hypothetical protein
VTPELRKEEDEFREALIKYLKANDCLSDTSFLTHWYIIGASEKMDDVGSSSVSSCPDSGASFAMQLGMLDYCQARLRGILVKDAFED